MPKTVSIHVRVTEAVYQRYLIAAVHEGLGMAEFIRAAANAYSKTFERRPGLSDRMRVPKTDMPVYEDDMDFFEAEDDEPAPSKPKPPTAEEKARYSAFNEEKPWVPQSGTPKRGR